MSLASDNIVIKRFTYDWLIRFAELHPFEIFDYDGPYSEYLPEGPYDHLDSSYAMISQFFNTIITRHMPYIFHSKDVVVKNGKIRVDEEDESPPDNKTKVYVCETLELSNLKPGTISSFKNNRVAFCYSKTLWLYENSEGPNDRNICTADELKYVLKSSPFGKKLWGFCAFDKPTMFSEIWPLLAHYNEIRCNIKNLIYGENIANVISKYQTFPDEIHFSNLNISDKAVLEMFDYFLSLPQCPVELIFTFLKPKPVSLFEAVGEKFVSAGHQNDNRVKPETSFNTIRTLVINNKDFTICYR